MGALDQGLEEWVLRNLQRLRAEYKQVVDNQARMPNEGFGTNQSDKGPHIKDDRMEEDVTPGAGDGRQPKEYQVLTKKNVRKLQKRLGAAKWVRRLGGLIEMKADSENELPDWANDLWDIILSFDKTV